MEKVQSALLGAAGAVASAGLVGKKAVGQKKTEAEKQASNSPSAIAAKKAQAALADSRYKQMKEHSYFVSPSLKDISGIKTEKKGE